MNKKNDIGVYIHWPFCAAKCPYCDFNSYVSQSIDQKRWRDSYIKAIEYYAGLTKGRRVVSVFFGGGTPSLMPPDTAGDIIAAIHRHWPMANDPEITLEANPTSVEAGKFKAFREAGINRVSLGVQALNDADLKFLGREHSAEEALKAVAIARDVFDRYSFDLMYARPGQTLESWQAELEGALPHAGGHISLYQLTIERSTPFYMDHAQGKFIMPGEDLSADFYVRTQEIMERAGLPAYEVSNHAAPERESRHNMIYWCYGDYVGIGPGAHGRLSIGDTKSATREHRAPDIWLKQMEEQGRAAHPFEDLTAPDRFMEALMVGLRLRSGVSLAALSDLTGHDGKKSVDTAKINQLAGQGWLEFDGDALRLNTEGLLRINAIVPYILKSVA